MISDAPNNPKVPIGDLTVDTARGFGNAPHITNVKYVRNQQTVTLTVRKPHSTGKLIAYEVYRSEGGLPLTNAAILQRINVGTPWPFPAGTTATVQIQDQGVQPNKQFTYYATTIQENPQGPSFPVVRSGVSNFRVVTTK